MVSYWGEFLTGGIVFMILAAVFQIGNMKRLARGEQFSWLGVLGAFSSALLGSLGVVVGLILLVTHLIKS